MHDAAEAGNLEVLQELLKFGASVEPDIDGISPLRLAALHGKEQIVQYFGSGKERVEIYFRFTLNSEPFRVPTKTFYTKFLTRVLIRNFR